MIELLSTFLGWPNGPLCLYNGLIKCPNISSHKCYFRSSIAEYPILLKLIRVSSVMNIFLFVPMQFHVKVFKNGICAIGVKFLSLAIFHG